MGVDTPLVCITRKVTPGGEGVQGAEVRMAPDERMSRAELLDFVHGASVIVSMYHDKVDAELLDAAGPSLRAVCNYAVGFENIDLDACRERNVVVTNTPDAVTEGTANIAWALILGVARRLVEADKFARSPAYAEGGPLGMADWMGVHLTGQRLLIVGAGRIGRAVALRGLGFGMKIDYVARSRHWDFELAPLAGTRVSLDEGLSRADVVSIHTPLTEQTRHLINAERLALMKPESILVNTARGPVVEEAPLIQALRERRIWGAGLDVHEFEPRVSSEMAALDNVILTPHIGSAERAYRSMMTQMALENASAILDGREAPNRIA